MGDLATLMPVNRSFWNGRRSFVTGHTGFKGGWLTTWLIDMGAQVSGYALPSNSEECYFDLCNLEQRLDSQFGNVLEAEALVAAMHRSQPEIVFHLAAQPIVRRSYLQPAQTFATNVMGTVNLLDAARRTPSVRAVIVITSDKCYENREWMWGYRETDPIGGHDPYSASKGCAELVTSAYQRSFFQLGESHIGAASVRAGNVFGGGDAAEDRIVPDAARALHNGERLLLRNPRAVRPWQHVLEPLAGYLMLAERLHTEGSLWSGGWNFGPDDAAAISVGSFADLLVKHGGGGSWQTADVSNAPHEARYLKLDCSKARTLLGWKPVLTLDEAVDLTMRWYRQSWTNPGVDMFSYSRGQIRDYEQLITKAG
jgi:CDP-glucose 4,6-dehydratase